MACTESSRSLPHLSSELPRVLLEGVGGIPMVCGKTTHSKVSFQMVEPRWLWASPKHSAALQDIGPLGTVCPSQCQAHSHQAGGWTGRGPHLHSRHALGQWPPSRNSYAPDHWVTPSPSLTGDLRFSRWRSPREPLENHLESSEGRISHFLITFPFSWYSSLLGPREGENAFYIILAAMWKRHISRDIGFGVKTHICKAYVKNVMHGKYEIYVVMAQASFVKHHRTGRAKPVGRTWAADLEDVSTEQGTRQHWEKR